ncbi:DNA/RNA nuclease SfsA, partial [Wenyingzhuangia sp. 1_MG-2023]|nr:DNA/RNA nuclease SfsA [Wenyingzhuangia sp. 1_MG-2023]
YKACINTARANQLVAEFLQAQLTAEPGTAPASSPDSLTISERFQGYTRVQREPKVTDGRLDFLLQGEGLPDLYIEVKSLT